MYMLSLSVQIWAREDVARVCLDPGARDRELRVFRKDGARGRNWQLILILILILPATSSPCTSRTSHPPQIQVSSSLCRPPVAQNIPSPKTNLSFQAAFKRP